MKSSVNKPIDGDLYDRVKARVYRENPKHSAYRSGKLVSEYVVAFKKKHGSRRRPYSGPKRSRTRGLGRWFAEKWVNQRGSVGYRYKSDIYRPTYRITRGTPLTHGEITARELRRARTLKARRGRVARFRRTQKGSIKKKRKGTK